MSTRSTSSNLFSPLRDPESLIRRRNLGEPSSIFDFEEVMNNSHNNQKPPPAGPPPPPNNNGPPLVVRPNGPAPRTMEELCQPSINGRDRPIAPIPIQATDFGLRHHMIQQQNGVSDDALRLSLFPYSLTHHATTWYDRLPRNFIHTFGDMMRKFLSKYFSPSMVIKLRNEITKFRQEPDESLFEAWEGYKLSLNRGRKFMQKTPKECYDLIGNMTALHNHRETSATRDETSRSISSTTTTESLEVGRQMELMNKNFQETMRHMQPIKAVNTKCETCGGPHSYTKCLAVSGYTQKAAYATTEVVERETKATKDKLQTTRLKSTTHVQPSIVQIPILEPDVASKAKPFADALLHIPKFASAFKSLLSNKEKLFKLANTSLTENCSTVLLKKLPEKLGDPGRFLIPCDFQGLESCMALADLGASINLMPLSVWKKLSLPELTSTRMTLELATRTYAYPGGIAEDVFVQVGKFTFPADFVVVDYDVNPHVPLILGISFLRMARVLVDVHGEELILRNGDEKLIFYADSTSKHPHKHGNESINMINFIDIKCEDRFPKVLKFKKSNHPSSGSSTPLSDSSPSLTPFETSDSLLEEFADELALLDPFSLGKEDNNFDFEADHREIEFLLNQDPSTESYIKTIDAILKKITNEPSLGYLPPSGDDDDDLFDLKSNNDNGKSFCMVIVTRTLILRKIKTKTLK
nr:reverse transcriptase domain-containing protein [Tanacetum cinerariifolium]